MNIISNVCLVALLATSALAKAQMPAESAEQNSGASRDWSYSFGADGYLVPDDSSYASLTFPPTTGGCISKPDITTKICRPDRPGRASILKQATN